MFYHGIIRKTIVSFGRLFSNVYIDRKQGDSVNGNTIQRLQIPLAYAPKEKWIVRIDSDPNLNNSTYVSLPRMSFEIVSYNYDPSRKLNRMQKITCGDGDTSRTFMYTPVPYNIDIGLYILTKTQEDGLQILEQILPTFTPEYNLSVRVVPEMNIIQDVPVILNSVSVADEYDGDFQTRRFVTHTLNFTIKTNLFGVVSSQNVIDNVQANVSGREIENPTRIYNATGDLSTGTVASEEWIDSF